MRTWGVSRNLGCLPQIEIAGMDVDDHISPLDVLDDGMSGLFCHRALWVTGEDAVHVEVEIGNTPLDGVDAQRIQSRINFQCSTEQFGMLTYDVCQFVAHHLPLQFVAVSACNHTEAETFLTVLYDILTDAELFINRQFRGYYCLCTCHG